MERCTAEVQRQVEGRGTVREIGRQLPTDSRRQFPRRGHGDGTNRGVQINPRQGLSSPLQPNGPPKGASMMIFGMVQL